MENILKIVILGFVQGISEFLPVSSSGHLLLLKKVMNLEVPMVFDICLHLATVLVVIIYYRERISELFLVLVKFFLRKTTEMDLRNLKLIFLILIITVITAVIGIFIGSFEGIFTLEFTLINFFATGILLLLLESRLLILNFRTNILFSGVFIGIMQGIGAMPGISRSGITIFASVLLGFSRYESLEISFLALIPIVFGSFLLKYKGLFASDMLFNVFEIILGVVIAFIVGLFSINLLVRMLKQARLYYFAAYLFILSSIMCFFFYFSRV
ncbi:undecaprenyl-diphosphate phosphatase [Candidatus Borreliella tachyglossi]|uniref:undecaprenyl-diphosphate phosphatase n=1 Tax=Candidatus Borreliella tachyglossi TaxID=1964448 RepID=UPI0040424783